MSIAKIISAAQIVLIGFIAFWAVRAIMVYFTPQSAWTPLTSGPALAPASSGAGGHRSRVIDTSFDPFHRDVVAAPVDLGQDAPETMLDLTLVGRRAGENGSAMLRLPNGTQKTFYIEDEVLSGVTLEAVNVDYIVIAQDGRLERLTLKKSDVSLLTAPKEEISQAEASASVTLSAEDALPDNAARPDKKAAYGNADGKTPRNVNYRNNNQASTASANPLLAALNFTPQRENNQVTGYKITPKQAGVNTAAFGLQAGDVITRIGSNNLQSENVDFGSVLAGLQGGAATTVNLIRNGQEISVKVGAP